MASRVFSALALADLHLDVLYELDEAGRLVPRIPADRVPSFHLMRTTEGNRWLLSAALSEDERARHEDALSREPVIGSLTEMETRPPALKGLPPLLEPEHPTSGDYRGPAFRCPEHFTLNSAPAELLSDPSRARCVPELSWIRDVTPAEHPLSVARNSSGEIVSVCHCARATASGAEAGVETAPGYRGRGLAGAVVLVWAHAVLADGRVPLYSTRWTNHASRVVARKLGLVPYGEDYHCP